MDIWKILNISPTKDKNILKKAYREVLSHVNPEDDSEGFMELRKAYEEALRLSDVNDDNTDENELSEIFRELYDDFERRIDVNEWKQLFDRSEFVSLDTGDEAGKALLTFLMTNIHLPREIWFYIVEMLDVRARKKELGEIFPDDFLEFMINNAEYDDLIDYKLFEGDEGQFDEYIDNYYRLDSAIRKRDFEVQGELVNKLESLDVYHPYYDICCIRREIQYLNSKLEKNNSDQTTVFTFASEYKDKITEFEDKLQKIYEKLPEDVFVISTCGDIRLLAERFDEAKKYYDIALELAPDNYTVKGKQAEVLYYLKEYKKSRDLYMDLLKINHFDNNVRVGMIKANQCLIEEYKQKLVDEPDNTRLKLEIVWSMYQSYRFSEAAELLDSFIPDEGQECEYYNVKGRTFLCMEEYDKALECFKIWMEELLKIPEDDMSEDSRAKRKRYEYVNFLMANCYLKTKKYDEARKYLETALKKEHEEIVLSLEASCELEYETGNDNACIDACERLLERDSISYLAYNYMSKAYFRMEYLRDSLNCCERAIALYPYVSDPYALEVKIYLKVNQCDAARMVIDRYRKMGIESDRIDFSEALIYGEEKQHDKVIDIIKKTLERSTPEDSDMDDFGELYMMLGFHMEKLGDTENAKKQYMKVIELYPEHKNAYGMLANIVRDEGDYKKALALFDKQLENNQASYYYIQRGLLKRFLQNYKGAIADFKNALEYNTDNGFCYTKLGQIYEACGELESALKGYEAALMYYSPDSEEYKELLISKARILQCLRRFSEGLVIYEEYIDNYGLNADIAYDYSELLFRMNRAYEAANILLKAINELEYSDEVQTCIRHLCYIYGSEGYIDKANEAMQLAINHNPNDERAYAVMGEIFFEHGLLDAARDRYMNAVLLDIGDGENYYSELIEVILAKRTLFKPDIKEYVKRAIIPLENMRLPVHYIKMSVLNRVLKKYKEAFKIIEHAINMRRCRGCFYEKCHEALYEKGRIYEDMKQYKKAYDCYKEALQVCGHNPIYEESMKRVEGK